MRSVVASRPPVRVVARILPTNTYGHNVVLGAIGADPPDGVDPVDLVRVASTEAECAAEVATGLREAERVLVTWSFYSADLPTVAAEVHRLRAAEPDVRVTHLAGGVHASAEPEATLRAGFDLVAVGEGEAVIVDVVHALWRGDTLAGRAGLAALDADGGYVAPREPAPRHDLDRFPAVAAPWDRYNPIEITRGCIYACRFCQTPYLFKARFRHRSVANVVEHVRAMRARGMRYVRFTTPTSLSYGTQTTEPDLGAVEELLAAVRREMGPDGRVYFGSFPSEVRPEHVSAEALAMLRRYVDNTNLIIGAQSGDDDVLEGAKRGHDVEAVERAVRLCVESGWQANVDLLFGLPGEDEAAARRTLALAERLSALGARLHAHTFVPLPGTPWRNAEPGRVSEAMATDLDRLASRGALYGHWKRQQTLGEQLVPLVRRTEPRPATG